MILYMYTLLIVFSHGVCTLQLVTDSYDRIFPAEDNNDKDVEDNCMHY